MTTTAQKVLRIVRRELPFHVVRFRKINDDSQGLTYTGESPCGKLWAIVEILYWTEEPDARRVDGVAFTARNNYAHREAARRQRITTNPYPR